MEGKLQSCRVVNKAWFPFGLFCPTENQNEQSNVQMETSTKNQKEQQKAIASNQRHLPVLVFKIEVILSQKQERATKSSKKQRTTMETRPKNQNEQ